MTALGKILRTVLAATGLTMVVGCAGTDGGPVRAGATIEYGELGGTEDVCDERSGWGQC